MSKQPTVSDELSRMGVEPLLDVEKKLVAGSLVLGVVLLVMLAWLSNWLNS